MKTCISLILTTLFLLAVLTGCSASGNVSTGKDGRINGRNSTESTEGIMDDPSRSGSSISPTTNNGMGGSSYGNGSSSDGYGGLNGMTDSSSGVSGGTGTR